MCRCRQRIKTLHANFRIMTTRHRKAEVCRQKEQGKKLEDKVRRCTSCCRLRLLYHTSSAEDKYCMWQTSLAFASIKISSIKRKQKCVPQLGYCRYNTTHRYTYKTHSVQCGWCMNLQSKSELTVIKLLPFQNLQASNVHHVTQQRFCHSQDHCKN